MRRGVAVRFKLFSVVLILAVLITMLPAEVGAERRDEWFRTRIPAYQDFYKLYNPLYRIGALANYWNLHTYDVLLTRPDPAFIDNAYYEELKSLALGKRIRLDPGVEEASPLFGRLTWGVGQSFMWTHALHENAFDAYAAPGLSMEERHRMVERATDDYFKNPRALASVEIPMERVRQLPYHGAFARKYPKMIGLIWAGHWFHGGVYEGQIAVVRAEKTREQIICDVETEFKRLVLNPPAQHPHFTHIAPNFTRLHPRAAGIFANMHMLHDMVADILADDRITDKRTAIYEARDMMLYSRTSSTAEGGTHHAH